MHNTDERCARGCSCRKCSETINGMISTLESEIVQEKCGDNADSRWGLRGYPLAQMYSPLQNFVEIYDCENALIKGTVFKELDLPFNCQSIYGGVSRG